MQRSERSRTSGLLRPCLPRICQISRDFDELHKKGRNAARDESSARA